MVAVKAMDADVAAGIAVGIVVGEVEARHLVQVFKDGLAGRLGVDEVLGDGGTFLGDRDRLHDAGDALGLARDGHGFDVFQRLGAGGLGEGAARHHQHQNRAGARHQDLLGQPCVHWSSPVKRIVKRARMLSRGSPRL